MNFFIAGFHHILIYDNGTKPGDINIGALIPTTVQPGPPLINDPLNRIYRGLDPSVMPALPGSTPPQPLQDRVETVRFPIRGKFLVICGVLPHFFDAATTSSSCSATSECEDRAVRRSSRSVRRLVRRPRCAMSLDVRRQGALCGSGVRAIAGGVDHRIGFGSSGRSTENTVP